MFNGVFIFCWESFCVKGGDVLKFGVVKMGVWVYLVIGGGIDMLTVLGFCAIYFCG